MTEPLHLSHCSGNTASEGGNLPLQVNEEGVRPPPADNLNGAVGYAGKVKSHGPS